MTRALGVAAVTCLLLLIVTKACEAQYDGVKYDQLQGYDGITFCTDKGAFSFVVTGLSAIRDADVKAHEAQHVKQVARFETCGAFRAWYRTPKGQMESEAEAYHAGWCVAVTMGADSVSLRRDYVEKIDHQLGGEINRLQIIQEFQKYACP